MADDVQKRTFQTPDGRSFRLKLDNGTVYRIAEATGISFFDLADDQRKFSELFFLWSHRLLPVFGELCRGQLLPDETVSKFLEQFDGETMEAARNALWEAFADFFRCHPIARQTKAMGLATMQAKTDADMMAAMAKEMNPASDGPTSLTNSPASSE